MRGVTETSALEELKKDPEQREYEEKSDLLKQMRAFEKAGRGRFKLELYLGAGRSAFKPYPGMLSFWESGTQLHGGGDAKIYMCPAKVLKRSDCQHYIPATSHRYGRAVCPQCGTAWKEEELVGEVMGKHTTQQWAEVLHQYFMRFDSNCDIYLKYSEGDLQAADIKERSGMGAGEHYAKAKKAQLVIYPLKHIMQDAAHTDILSRFQVFLNT